MSPPSREISGPRSSPLKTQKDSHQIQKKPSTATNHQHHHQPPRLPVIIYTHSPKIIHTQAQDFMALVQRLTGLTRSPDANPKDEREPPPSTPLQPMSAASSDGTDTADGNEKKTVEAHHDAEADGANVDPALAIELFDDQYMFPDMSLTPEGSSDFLCSPRSLYIGGSVSPSFTEGMPDF